MDPFHQRLARVALEAAAGYGLCLAGGYAVQVHGFIERVSKDVDLFTVEREGASFARLVVTDPEAQRGRWRTVSARA